LEDLDEVIEKEDVEIKDMIYEIRGVDVMFDSEIFATKCHDYFYVKIVTHYDIGNPILMFINFADASAKLERSQII